jgi:spore germination cell wall hydrolase CwlJ-like protein
MIGPMRARGFAAAFLMLASLFSVPAAAATSIVAPKPSTEIEAAAEPTSAVPAAATLEVQAPAAVSAAPVAVRPIRDLVISHVDFGNRDSQQDCLVKAIYFEARSESLEGQLAVAEVILNRAVSGVYPSSICGVVTQPAQFSFIRNGRFPTPNKDSQAWRTAVAIADIALKAQADLVPANVLWYHATYVSPSWGRRLTRVVQIGTHIFYS